MAFCQAKSLREARKKKTILSAALLRHAARGGPHEMGPGDPVI
jgi:hypothetical protein